MVSLFRNNKSTDEARSSRLFYLQLYHTLWGPSAFSEKGEEEEMDGNGREREKSSRNVTESFTLRRNPSSLNYDQGRERINLWSIYRTNFLFYRRRTYFLILLIIIVSLILLHIDNILSSSNGSHNSTLKLCIRNPLSTQRALSQNISRDLSSFLLIAISPFYSEPGLLNQTSLLRDLSEKYQTLLFDDGDTLQTLLTSLAPSCEDVLLSCQLNDDIKLNGMECCSMYVLLEGYDLSGYCWTIDLGAYIKAVFVLNMRLSLSNNIDGRIIDLNNPRKANKGLYLYIDDGNVIPVQEKDDLFIWIDPNGSSTSYDSNEKYTLIDDCRIRNIHNIALNQLNCSLLSMYHDQSKSSSLCSPSQSLKLYSILRQRRYRTTYNPQIRDAFFQGINEHCLMDNNKGLKRGKIHIRKSSITHANFRNLSRFTLQSYSKSYNNLQMTKQRQHFEYFKENSGFCALLSIILFLLYKMTRRF
ncbi:uncharacterized protein [Lepeophtheirus salmonis]|uniref:uncharacterized protein n=1 Tax=Lepeophtheirus salmonis TaxID=72036 RepID=UPI003AF33EE0